MMLGELPGVLRGATAEESVIDPRDRDDRGEQDQREDDPHVGPPEGGEQGHEHQRDGQRDGRQRPGHAAIPGELRLQRLGLEAQPPELAPPVSQAGRPCGVGVGVGLRGRGFIISL